MQGPCKREVGFMTIDIEHGLLEVLKVVFDILTVCLTKTKGKNICHTNQTLSNIPYLDEEHEYVLKVLTIII